MFFELNVPIQDQLLLVVRLLLSALCGCVIGFERKNRKKEAGIRTHIIVALASCLMMEISKYGFLDGGPYDGSRVAAQIVSGIGFLGAGMIFVHKNSIKGLTTAAGIWATSGIGMAIGAGMHFIGVVATALIFVIQIILHQNFKILKHVVYESITFTVDGGNDAVDYIKSIMVANGLACESASIVRLSGSRIKIEVATSFHEDFDMFEFVRNVSKDERIISVYNESSKN